MGINVTDLVSKLMEIEKQPLNALNSKKETLQTEANAWRELNSRLYALQEAAYKLQSVATFRARSASVSESDALSVTCDSGAQTAAYRIEVVQLAKAHTVTFGGLDGFTVADEDTVLDLTEGILKINGKDVNVTADDTLQSLAEKINNTEDAGVIASVVKVDATHYKLVVSSEETGEANQIDFSGSDASVLASLGQVQTQAAQNAKVTINGLTIERETNIIDDAISNLTLTLKKENVTTDVTVMMDKDQLIDAVKTFVEKYNNVMDYINENTKYTYDSDTEKGSSGPLFGDSTLTNLDSQLRSYLSMTVEGVDSALSMLGLVGITSASGIEGVKSGKLEFDETEFSNKLDTNLDDIKKLFSSTDGIFTKMYNNLFKMTSSTGTLQARINSINNEMADINDLIESMEERLEQKETQYLMKYRAMELALSQLQNQSSQLISLLASYGD